MARTSLSSREQLSKVSSQTLSVSNIPVPYTTIVNRAQIKDLANDLSVRFGVERISIQQIAQLNSEFGASGEPVFKAVNDTYDQVRFVGAGWTNSLTSNGAYIGTTSASDYCEITFYGTGLNLLSLVGGTAVLHNLQYSLDGGVYTSFLNSSTLSTVLGNRNNASNMLFSVINGLSIGTHTIKILNTNASVSGFNVYGFEILNENSTLNIRPGALLNNGSKNYLSSSTTSSYSSGFESGTLGTRGGHALVYLKSDGTIAKAVTPTNASVAYLTSADHTNEEIIRKINWREFGAGRSDDFSYFSSASATNLAFTLDDGTTSLVGSQVGYNSTYSTINISGAAGSFISITFIGTGLDIIEKDPGTIDSVTVTVDNASAGSLTTSSTNARQVKIVSGLPYGTHTVKFTRSVAVNAGAGFTDFIIYQPKKPTLPSGAMELSEYNIMADYSANSTSSIDAIATGILRKFCTREISYAGSNAFTVNTLTPTSFAGGFEVLQSVAGASNTITYYFFGTGFDWRQLANTTTGTVTYSVDGLTLNTTNFPSVTVSSYGFTNAYNTSTGVQDQVSASTTFAGVKCTGLSLGFHKLVVTSNASTQMRVSCIDVISPVHFPKIKGQFVSQNTLPIGSCSVGDLREKQLVDSNAGKNIAQAQWLGSNVTSTSTSYAPVPSMSVTHYNTSGKIRISMWANMWMGTVTASWYLAFFIDGVQVSLDFGLQEGGSANVSVPCSPSGVYNVAPGFHKIDVYWKVGSGTVTSADRSITVEEL